MRTDTPDLTRATALVEEIAANVPKVLEALDRLRADLAGDAEPVPSGDR